jgi:hypothetical protein
MLPLSPLDEAQQNLANAAETLRTVGQGSAEPDLEYSLGMMEQARKLLGEVGQLVASIRERVGQIADAIGGVPPAPAGAASPPTGALPVPASRIAEVMAALPPPVDHPPPRGQPYVRTHGRLLDRNGKVAAALVSGSDDDSAAAKQALAELGLPPVAVATHVEMKAVLRARQAGLIHATLVVNNTPCPGPFGCDRLLPVLLRSGESLTVHWPGGHSRTYSGRRRP